MPIQIKDFTWNQTDTHVSIVVPLKGAQASKTAIFSSELYIKVNFPPYFFEADLFAAIDDQLSSAQIGNGAVNFNLKKKEEVPWPLLICSDSKENLKVRRAETENASRQRAVELAERHVVERRDADKAALRKQMEVESAIEEDFKAQKEKEKQLVSTDLEKLKQSNALHAPNVMDAMHLPVACNNPTPTVSNTPTPIRSGPNSAVAAVRSSGQIPVSFTPRAFITPLLESAREQEAEWLSKQAEARKAVQEAKALLGTDRIENDPLWMKDRGIEFFKANNFQGAINAFTSGITLDSQNASLYSNRAACHMKLGDFFACCADCSKAISLLTPPVDANAKSRLLAYSRRGAALVAVGDLPSALDDYCAALLIEPGNEMLKADRHRIEQQLRDAVEKGS